MAKDMAKKVQQLDQVVIRFAGDSGDGMQLTGDRFTSETAQLGNDIPVVYQDYPQSTQADISAQTFLKIVGAHPSGVMFKHEDCPGLRKLSQVRRACDGAIPSPGARSAASPRSSTSTRPRCSSRLRLRNWSREPRPRQ